MKKYTVESAWIVRVVEEVWASDEEAALEKARAPEVRAESAPCLSGSQGLRRSLPVVVAPSRVASIDVDDEPSAQIVRGECGEAHGYSDLAVDHCNWSRSLRG